MNQASNSIPDALTENVIEFLTQPGSDFGTQPDDVDSLRTPDALVGQFQLRLEAPITNSEAPERRQLRERLRGSDLQTVNWSHVTQELRVRLRLTDGFFSQDLPSHESASQGGSIEPAAP